MNMKSPQLFGLLLVGLISGCSLAGSQPPWLAAVAGDGPGHLAKIDDTEPVVANLPRSRSGNPRSYTVFGRSYDVMQDAHDFRERGEASWYGRKFHGRPTSSGEIYDMHRLTAAHKHLPLPTFVRVTRVDTGQSVVVKVNDRGPFVGERIIDLSYAAAARLDMLEGGKAEVIVEALSRNEDVAAGSAPATDQPAPATNSPAWHFLQIGAFSEQQNAQVMLARLQRSVSMPAAIHHDAAGQLYRVRIGPLADAMLVKQARDSLAQAGFDSYTLITANP
jgi:rare lipoprotein A